ncbi:MAG TPA: phospholipase D family protein [Actinocrinis sp.]|nr:phospholipase D family protein [Actinocrinis sp.]
MSTPSRPWRAALDDIDQRFGDQVDRLVCAHHHRRLDRLGWSEVLSETPGDGQDVRPAREGNRVQVLVDGEEALAAMAEAIAGATSHVHIAGWFASPHFRPTRGPGAPTLAELLASVAERVPVRLLLWAGPPAPVFKPTRRMTKAAREDFLRDSKVRCVLDRRERTMHCHHEKIVVVDDEVAFVGGIDFTDLAGDRLDSSAHSPDRVLGWHDAATRLHGPIVADVAAHFAQRWSEVAVETLPEPVVQPPAGTTAVQLVRTVPERTYKFAERGEFTILQAYLSALRSARSLVYLENQFLWSSEVVDVLVDKLLRPPQEDFRLLVLLPTRPNDGADTTRGQLGRLIDADAGNGRLLAVTVNSHSADKTAPLYVHAKVGIVDDAWLTVGSANLNEHSLFNDTEVNVIIRDPDQVRATRLRLWSEHLQLTETEVSGEPATVIDTLWRPTATEQAFLDQAGSPRTHRLILLENLSRRAERLQGPLRGLLVDG